MVIGVDCLKSLFIFFDLRFLLIIDSILIDYEDIINSLNKLKSIS